MIQNHYTFSLYSSFMGFWSTLGTAIDVLAGAWCPVCDTKMEGGPGGRRKWWCPNCGQLFDVDGNAVN